MAITYPLDTPTSIGISNIVLGSQNAVATTESPFTYDRQSVALGGERWSATVTIPQVHRDLAEPWVVFLLSLKGSLGTFLLGDPNCVQAQGSASTTPGTPVVNGADQTGSSLDISGLPISTTGYLLPGDYIQLGSASTATLHKVLQQVDSDGSGNATVELWPSIKTAPVDASNVIVEDAKGLFRLSSNASSWQINSISVYGLEFEAIGVV